MTYALVVRQQALVEAATIFSYYGRVAPGIAEKFAARLAECYAFITRNPTALPIRKGIYRHMMLTGFRYRVVYAIHQSQVVVVQIRHTSRRVSRRYGP